MPVAYAEIAPFWIQNSPAVDQIAAVVDHIVVHIYPFWEGVSIEEAPKFYENMIVKVRAKFPGKSVSVGETGWPADGQTVGKAVASSANQATWFRFISNRSHRDRAYYFSAYSKDWKSDEGPVGPAWGIYRANGTIRPALEPIIQSHIGKDVNLNFRRTAINGHQGVTKNVLCGP